ncbi:MAG: DegT/DnrJ/EryC1/StrS family aminotransferase [Candidatus Omnitrophica bacterium]|jgi:dTDP-4-amino-4,6-dideoxygalactose transaminase|nr:DegT/DnrJ/EryC1/StrS family aminotransferase [Candidatus Omnitrophota bacterium]
MSKKINIPSLDLKREYAFLKKGINRQIKDCLGSQQWILGTQVKELESKVSKYLKAKYTIGVASGTDALLLSLRSLAIQIKNKEYFNGDDEIITTPFTFVATAEAIVRSGAKPVFVDINPKSFNINPENIKRAINKNTVGIIPVHLFGRSSEMNEISQIAKENNLFILEDVAQAFGAGFNGKKLGTIGNCGAFSFFPSKTLGSYGDAGLIATNDEQLASIAKILRVHGQTAQYNAKYIGYNSRLDSMQAAILLAKFKYVDKFNGLRQKVARKYHNGLKDIKGIQLPNSYGHIYNLYTIKTKADTRDKMLKFLNDAGIGARIYYPFGLNKMEAFRTAKISGNLDNADKAAKSVLSLPINPFLKDKEIDYIIEKIRVFSKERAGSAI